MAITRCCISPMYRINVNASRKLEYLARRSGTARELQSVKFWNVHSKVYWATRELLTSLFCLPPNKNNYPSSSRRNSDGDDITELTPVSTKEIRQSHDSLDATDNRQCSIDSNFYGVCSELLDIHSSISSAGLTDANLQSMNREGEDVLILEGHGDISDSNGKDLGENVNELHKVMKMERISHIRESGSGCYVLNPRDLTGSKDKKGYWFPYMDKFKSGNVTLSSSEVLHVLDPYILETRKRRIREVVRNRTYSICLVVEGLTDFGNISAVFRSADALGFQSVHVISNDSTKRYKQNRNVSMGSEKWLDIEQWETTRECFEVLRFRGYQIAVAYIGSDTVSVCNMDWTLPTAIVLGNEHKGISDEALELSDMRCSIPMTGMVDSLNVSVAAGICMHSAVCDRISRLVAETRFASHTLVLRRLVKVKDALSGMVISSNWGVWKNANTERATKIKLLILDDAWWERVEYLLSFTEPILSMLRFADMDHPCLGEIYDGIDSMIESIKSIINEKEKDPTESFFKEIQTHLIDRWNKMTTPLHLLAFSLTPKYYSAEILSLPRRVAPYKDLEVSEGCKVALTRLFPDPELHDAVRKEFVDFISSRNQSIIALRDKYKMDGYSWWFLHGQAYPNLQTLAIKMLAQGSHGDLKPKESQVLTAEFYLRHKKNIISIMDCVVEKESLGEICV